MPYGVDSLEVSKRHRGTDKAEQPFDGAARSLLVRWRVQFHQQLPHSHVSRGALPHRQALEGPVLHGLHVYFQDIQVLCVSQQLHVLGQGVCRELGAVGQEVVRVCLRQASAATAQHNNTQTDRGQSPNATMVRYIQS